MIQTQDSGISVTEIAEHNKKPIRTIRNILSKLVEFGVIKHIGKNLPNNEKRYVIADQDEAEQLIEYHMEFLDGSGCWEVDQIAMYNHGYGKEFYILIYYSESFADIEDNQGKMITRPMIRRYPVKLYQKKLCPICQGILRRFSPGMQSDMDRRCISCKFTFVVTNKVIRAYEKFSSEQSLEDLRGSIQSINRDTLRIKEAYLDINKEDADSLELYFPKGYMSSRIRKAKKSFTQ
jgi:DNA-binding Lrp family transcriptional regulator